jgi:hypothetical protein
MRRDPNILLHTTIFIKADIEQLGLGAVLDFTFVSNQCPHVKLDGTVVKQDLVLPIGDYSHCLRTNEIDLGPEPRQVSLDSGLDEVNVVTWFV